MKINKIFGYAGLAVGMLFTATSCKKSYLDTKPSDQVMLEDVFKTTVGARSVVNGMHRILYSRTAGITAHTKFGLPSLNMMYDLMGEDFGMSRYNWFYAEANYSSARNGDVLNWTMYYDVINNANFLLKYIDDATGSQGDKDELKGQAYAMRGWAYLQLIQSYQFAYRSPQYLVAAEGERTATSVPGATPSQAIGVPIYTEPSQKAQPRASLLETTNRIQQDLDSSIHYFDQPGVVARGSDKSQININVAHGIRARYNLYMQKWQEAADDAKLARQGYSLADSSQLYDGFNNILASEWMWGSLINQEANSIYASFMSHMDPRIGGYAASCQKTIGREIYRGSGTNPAGLDSFDYRLKWWIPSTNAGRNYYFPNNPEYASWSLGSQLKFRSVGPSSFLADYPMMRVAEMYLVEAEGLAMAGNQSGSIDVLEEFMAKRNPRFSSAALTSKDLLVQMIWRQRRVELWGEGFRLFDAKRQMATISGVTSRVSIDRSVNSPGWNNSVYSSNSTVQAGSPNLNFRIPGSELLQNLECVQNP